MESFAGISKAAPQRAIRRVGRWLDAVTINVRAPGRHGRRGVLAAWVPALVPGARFTL